MYANYAKNRQWADGLICALYGQFKHTYCTSSEDINHFVTVTLTRTFSSTIKLKQNTVHTFYTHAKCNY